MNHDTKHKLMTALGLPVFGIGLETWIHEATGILGLYTACTGAVIGTFGVIWWRRRLMRQRVEEEKESEK